MRCDHGIDTGLFTATPQDLPELVVRDSFLGHVSAAPKRRKEGTVVVAPGLEPAFQVIHYRAVQDRDAASSALYVQYDLSPTEVEFVHRNRDQLVPSCTGRCSQ